eukprot:m.32096 g.32096  ORF g.32096 m.32096 type:complete len:251 (+) comp31596_c0_seq5:320-1072(+)
MSSRILSHGDLLKLKRWNTPTIYNGWEQITSHDAARDGFNMEETKDFMPFMGPMIGYAVTLVIQPSGGATKEKNPAQLAKYLEYVSSVPGPKIVVVQDLDKPEVYGSVWGEVMANIHRSLGCVGTIVDGAIRDVDEMTNAGFKALAQRLCVGHANAWPIRWNEEVEVFRRKVKPGQLIHADKHGFLVIPDEDQSRVLDAATFMDENECDELVSQVRSAVSQKEALELFDKGRRRFKEKIEKKFGHQKEDA